MNVAYKRPESILVLVHTLAGEVLMMERREPPGFWQSVTGSLEWGESAPEAARRELREETGLVAGPQLIDCGYSNQFEILPAWRARYAPGVKRNLEHVFRVEYTARPPIQITLDEHSRYLWLGRSDAIERASSHTNAEAIRRFVAAN